MRKTGIYIVIFIVTSILLASCGNQVSLLFDETCEPPCWMGIEPGTTSVKEALNIINDIDAVNKSEIANESVENVTERGFVSWVFIGNVPDETGRIYFRDDQVHLIDIGSNVSVGEYLARVGSPEKVIALRGRIETIWVSIDLLYPSRGIIVRYNDKRFFGASKGPIRIKGNMDIWSVLYFDPTLYEEVLREEVLSGLYGVSEAELEKAIHDWKGFGKIEPLNLLER